MPFCRKCGNQVAEDAKFCEKCGNQLKIQNSKGDFGTRVIAYLIDGILIGIPTNILYFWTIDEDFAPTAGLISILVPVIYFTYYFGTTGQTCGKKWMNLKVVSIDGTPLTYSKGFLRYIGYWVSIITLGLGFLWIIKDANKQGFHDKIAGTYVVKV